MENINPLEVLFGHMKNDDLLKQKIEKAKNAYYNTDTPIMTDKEYDNLIKEYGEEPFVGAPVLDFIEKISITDKPMLSLDKVHSISEIQDFKKDKDVIATIKCDGLSVRLIYEDGKLRGANTRGNGFIGGNIYNHAHYIQNIPLEIPRFERFVIDGEVIIFEKDFDYNKFKNQRNAAAGALSLLDMNEVKQRNLSFIVWDIILPNENYTLYSQKLKEAIILGFEAVPWIKVNEDNIQSSIDFCLDKAKINGCPCDGVVFRYNDIQYGDSLGSTTHHFKNAVAWKPNNETYSTRLRYIDWTMGRTGVLTPVAVFNPVEIDGTEVSRANLHNYSVMREVLGDCAYVGEHLEIYKANQIIPQVYSAGPKYNYGEVIAAGGVSAKDTPERCPICFGDLAYRTENGVTRVYCDNPQCSGKLINRLEHFCGKKGLDIKGLSKKTLEKLIEWGWIEYLEDIFQLEKHREDWIKKSGFGITSVDKILEAIKDATNCSTDKFICAIGIPLIGKVASEALAKKFSTYDNFRTAIESKDEKFYQIAGIGEVMIETILNFDYTEADATSKFISEIASIPSSNDTIFEGKIFVITGKLKIFKNRDELKTLIESKGGKVANSVTSKTSYLINNDTGSRTTKNLTAIKLHIPIINEDEFLTFITPPNLNIEPSYLASTT